MIAAALLWCAYDLRRPHEAFIPYATLGSWCLALLALPALHAADLTRTGAPLLIYLAALIALLALAGLGVTRRRSPLSLGSCAAAGVPERLAHPHACHCSNDCS